MTKNNLKIWNSVCVTNPANTKNVNYGARHFTAIDAHSQIFAATEVFGAVGEGWGWESKQIVLDPRTITLEVRLWYKSPETGERCYMGEVYGCKGIGEGKPDEDAPKKALTDGITKSLSYIGFNADVFMGKFDDSKYVDEARKKFNPSVNKSKKRPKGEKPDIDDETVAAIKGLRVALMEIDKVRPTDEIVGWHDKTENDVLIWFSEMAETKQWEVTAETIDSVTAMVTVKVQEYEQC